MNNIDNDCEYDILDDEFDEDDSFYEEIEFVILDKNDLNKIIEEDYYVLNIYNISSDYSNKCFCYYCINYFNIHKTDYEYLLDKYYYNNKNTKILILLYRLWTDLFMNIDISTHKVLANINIPLTKSFEHWRFIFDIYFYQPNLILDDYAQCDICKICICPLHQEICPFLYKKCIICNKKNWSLCGKCKNKYIPGYICNKYHT